MTKQPFLNPNGIKLNYDDVDDKSTNSSKYFGNTKLMAIIKNAVPEGATPLLISIIGSRAKGIETNDSDLNVVVIVRCGGLTNFDKTTYRRGDCITVEVNCLSIEEALKLASETNFKIYEALYSFVLYEHAGIPELRETFKLNYDPQKMRTPLARWMNHMAG